METEATSEREEALSKIGGLIHDIRMAMLTTAAPDGSLHSRPMATQNSDFHGELWFLTRADSGKVYEIRDDSHVSVTYADAKSSFVALSGRATLSRDQQKIDELWNSAYFAWFPEGKSDPEIRVLRVIVETAQYWEGPSNAVVRSFQIFLAAATAGHTKVGESGRITLA